MSNYKQHREPILIGDWMQQMGIIRSDQSVDTDLVCTLFYYDQKCTSSAPHSFPTGGPTPTLSEDLTEG